MPVQVQSPTQEKKLSLCKCGNPLSGRRILCRTCQQRGYRQKMYLDVNRERTCPICKDSYRGWRKTCQSCYTKNWYKRSKDKPFFQKYKDPVVKRRLMLKRRYGLTEADVETFFKAQDGKCGICQIAKPKVGKTGSTGNAGRIHNMVVDHNHLTGQVRGLLCTGCNSGVGHFQDSIDILNKAIAYLQREVK